VRTEPKGEPVRVRVGAHPGCIKFRETLLSALFQKFAAVPSERDLETAPFGLDLREIGGDAIEYLTSIGTVAWARLDSCSITDTLRAYQPTVDGPTTPETMIAVIAVQSTLGTGPIRLGR
jgi:hypothetical protein